MAATLPLPELLLLLLLSCLSARAQLDIIAITPSPESGSSGAPNTVIGAVGSQIASALLPPGAAAMLWGAVPSTAVIAACELIVNTGQHSFTANITNDWGGSEILTLQVIATGGCLAASDASGTQFAFVDNHGRYSAVVCPSNDAGTIGCGVYITGDDITQIYNSWDGGSNLQQLLHPTSSRILQEIDEPIKGNITGVMTAVSCSELDPLASFCVPGELGFARSCPVCTHECTCGNGDGCFPGDALVRTRHGIVIPMSELQLNDEVAVWGHDGLVTYDDVYAFGHKDAQAISNFIEIIVKLLNLPSDHLNSTTTTTIRLSAGHFLPTSTSSTGNIALVYKRARDIQVGDIVLATYPSTSGHNVHVLPSCVKAISTTWRHGLYNPLTLSGTIIVDDVVASVHSEWFLDSIFDTLGLSHWLPTTYQFVLAPVRGVYQMMGNKVYHFLYDKIDAYLDIPKFGTHYGGPITLGACATLFTPLIVRLVVQAQKPSNFVGVCAPLLRSCNEQ